MASSKLITPPEDGGYIVPETYVADLVDRLRRQTVWYPAPSGARYAVRVSRLAMLRGRLSDMRERLALRIAPWLAPDDDY